MMIKLVAKYWKMLCKIISAEGNTDLQRPKPQVVPQQPVSVRV